MKTLALALLMAAGLGAGTAQAQTPEPAEPVAGQAAAPALKRCPPPTGSRIARAPEQDGRCSGLDASGRSYTKEDIDRTGEFDLNNALRRLDPAITSRVNSQGSQR